MAKATGVTDYKALYSTKEYKKIRLSYFTPELEQWEDETLAREGSQPPPSGGGWVPGAGAA